MISRGKLLVELALKKSDLKHPTTRDTNNNSTKSCQSRRQATSETPCAHNRLYRMQGAKVTDVERYLYCNEDISDATQQTPDETTTAQKERENDMGFCDSYQIQSSKVTHIENVLHCYEDNGNFHNLQTVQPTGVYTQEKRESELALPDTYSHDCSESDDSVKDPDWKLDSKRGKRDRYTDSDDSDVDNIDRKRSKTKSKLKQVKANPIAHELIENQIIQNIYDTSDEILPGSSQDEIPIDHEEEVVTESGQTNDNDIKVPRAKKGMGNPDKWIRNVNKKLRMQGMAYKGVAKVSGKKSHSKERGERIQGEQNCKDRCKITRKCFDIRPSLRQEIFQAFWNRMDWVEKKSYVISLVNRCESLKGKRDGRRQYTYKYHLRDGDNKVPVCKNCFLSILGIREYTVYEWLKKTDDNGLPRESNSIPRTRKEINGTDVAKEFLESLPKMPSHYCRSTSTKVYLEPVFTSFADLFRIYKQYCIEKEQKVVGRKYLKKMFDHMNLSLFRPKKDQCDVCVGYETNNIPEDEYQQHIRKKDAARVEKERDKQRASQGGNVKVFTMDVQSVLLCPKVEASAMYYKTKLSGHNFTMYDLSTKHVKCYFWHEGEGGLTANSFASCIYDHVESIIKPDTEEVIFYSDGCGYQNRNVTLSNTLLKLAVKHKTVITQNILEKGHTQMEVDSVHSTIERCIKRRPIYSPSNYVELFKAARKEQPYQVIYLDHTFFGDFSSLKYYESIRPGYRVGDPNVADIRSLRYQPQGVIQYKLSYSDNFTDIPLRRNGKVPSGDEVVLPLYQNQQQIKKTKYDHLQQLKAVIPKDYHPFYDNLSYVH